MDNYDDKIKCFNELLLFNINNDEIIDILDDESIEFINSEIMELINENNNIITEPKYLQYIYTHLYNYCKSFMDVELKYDLTLIHILKKMKLVRSYQNTYVYNKTNIKKEYIQYLKDIPQPKQRSEEWYQYRYNHITASNGWKAYTSNECVINELIYEKCKPYEIKNYNSLSENAMTWGQKYEPLTSMIYEDIYNTKIEEFGCIPHKKHLFLAASPDGIVTGENNFGRMIEIKNVVSREINGNPKKEYYIQVQLQLEVCDLEECDFVETKFIEYENYTEFLNDGDFIHTNKENKKKGAIIVYIKNNSEFIYEYVYTQNKEEFMERINNKNETEEIVWYKDIYWRLEIFSCVLIPRSNTWFDLTFNQLEKVWSTIIDERETGDYIKRAPKKRKKIEKNKQTNCLIKVI